MGGDVELRPPGRMAALTMHLLPVVALGWQRGDSLHPLLNSRQPISARIATTGAQRQFVLSTSALGGSDNSSNSRLFAGTLLFDESFNEDQETRAATAETVSNPTNENGLSTSATTALLKLEDDMKLLDEAVGPKAQLTTLEASLLASMVATAGLCPFLCPPETVEVVVPSAAAVCTFMGLSSEFAGKVAVADGKEIASLTIRAAAEAEALLAAAEREKAVIPLCVGSTVAALTFSLLAPHLLEGAAARFGLPLATELCLFAPIIATVAAALAGLAAQETQRLCRRATGLGKRRFAKSSNVAVTWLSSTELVMRGSEGQAKRFKLFTLSLLPGPLLGFFLTPGALAFKGIVAAAVSACQTHFYLQHAEYELARTMDAVALKKRIAAVSDTYANQGYRSGAILPFTSALGGLCTAAAAAAAEVVPLIPPALHPAQAAVCVAFPACGALCAAAASVAKARCKVDASATRAATEAFAETGDEKAASGERQAETAAGFWWQRQRQRQVAVGRRSLLSLSSVASASRRAVRRLADRARRTAAADSGSGSGSASSSFIARAYRYNTT